MEPFLGLPPRPSTSITSPLGGTVHLVSNELSTSFWTKLENVPRDSSGESLAFRLTAYVTRILQLNNVFESLNSEQREVLFHYLPLALQLIEDDMSIEGSIGLVGLQLSEDYDGALEITSSGRSIVSAWVHSDAHPSGSQISISEELYSSWNRKIEAVNDVSPESYRIGEAFVKLMSQKESTKTSDELVSVSREIRKLSTVRGAAAIAIWGPSLSYSSAGTRLCNELIAEATGFNPQKNREGRRIMTYAKLLLTEPGFKNIVFANILIQNMETIVDSIPTQRVVFLVKNIIQVVQENLNSLDIRSEVFKLLRSVLRPLNEIYGSHWADSIEMLNTTWKEISGGDAALPVLHSSFRFFSVIKRLVQEQGNDDLIDSWAESKNELFGSIVSILHKLGTPNPPVDVMKKKKKKLWLTSSRCFKCCLSASGYNS